MTVRFTLCVDRNSALLCVSEHQGSGDLEAPCEGVERMARIPPVLPTRTFVSLVSLGMLSDGHVCLRCNGVSVLLVFQRCLTQPQSGNPRWCSQPSSDEQQYTGNYSRSVGFFSTTSAFSFFLSEGSLLARTESNVRR